MKNIHKRAVTVLVLGAGGLVGCSGTGGNVNIGDTSPVGAKLSDYAASWDGYAQAYGFWPNGSDRVRLTIDAQGHGNLRVGSGDLLAAPTDPDEFTPANIAALPQWSDLVEGGLYPTHAAEVQAGRIQFGINPWDLEAAWCALQTPYPLPSGGVAIADGGQVQEHYDYSCLPSFASATSGPDCSYTDADKQTHPVSCAKLWLCQETFACACTATGCAGRDLSYATAANQYPDEFDAALDASGRTLTATLNLDGNRITVVMQRQ
jgi:hypothetical protein